MSRGDSWERFLQLLGPFILHVLKSDYGFYEDFDQHTRQEILHDIYIRTARHAQKLATFDSAAIIRAYIRKVITSVMSNKRRMLRRWHREIQLDPEQTELMTKNTSGHFNPLTWLEDTWFSRNRETLLLAAVQQAVQHSQKPKRNQRILEMKLLEGKAYSEIASMNGTSEDAARQTVSYFRPKVLAALKRRASDG